MVARAVARYTHVHRDLRDLAATTPLGRKAHGSAMIRNWAAVLDQVSVATQASLGGRQRRGADEAPPPCDVEGEHDDNARSDHHGEGRQEGTDGINAGQDEPDP